MTHDAPSLDDTDFDAVAPPPFLRGRPIRTYYDGVTDDLLTAGLGLPALAVADPLSAAAVLARSSVPSLQPPAPASQSPAPPSLPLPADQRRNTILLSHYGLIDRNPGAGYGSLYGPGVVAGEIVSDGRIAGHEYLMALEPLAGVDPVVVVVQIPGSFDPARPRIIAAASSGSRGVYGAVAPVGEWALPRGFAVVYTDKGTGIGAHDLQRNTAFLINGQIADADALGSAAHFRARLDDGERQRFSSEWPHRLAFKHAHAQINPERWWGREVLRAIRVAYYLTTTSPQPPQRR